MACLEHYCMECKHVVLNNDLNYKTCEKCGKQRIITTIDEEPPEPKDFKLDMV